MKKNTIMNVKQKVVSTTASLALGMSMLPTKVFAYTVGDLQDGQAKDGSLIQNILKWIADFIPFIGLGFGIVGGVQLIMAFRNDQNPEAMGTAVKNLVVAAGLIAFSVIYGMIEKSM